MKWFLSASQHHKASAGLTPDHMVKVGLLTEKKTKKRKTISSIKNVTVSWLAVLDGIFYLVSKHIAVQDALKYGFLVWVNVWFTRTLFNAECLGSECNTGHMTCQLRHQWNGHA